MASHGIKRSQMLFLPFSMLWIALGATVLIFIIQLGNARHNRRRSARQERRANFGDRIKGRTHYRAESPSKEEGEVKPPSQD